MTNQVESLSYANAGVDIDAGNALVERIKPLAKATSRSGCMSSLGGFGALFDLKDANYNDPLLVSATDGVGTKLRLALDTGIHNTVGIDLVAMCVNDLIVQGGEPLFFLDYFACGTLNISHAEQVISGISEGCKQAGCALVGGETAEMPGMYESEDYDLAGFSVGAVERNQLLPNMNQMQEGDILLGIASSGFHSNGFSLVRKIIDHVGLNFNDPSPFANDQTLAESLLTPTKIYVKSCLNTISQTGESIKGLAHITGGGLTENIPRVLPDHLSANINLNSWELAAPFKWAAKSGNISQAEMLKTFNCGIGMILVCANDKAEQISNLLTKQCETVHNIGTLTTRNNDSVTYEGEL